MPVGPTPPSEAAVHSARNVWAWAAGIAIHAAMKAAARRTKREACSHHAGSGANATAAEESNRGTLKDERVVRRDPSISQKVFLRCGWLSNSRHGKLGPKPTPSRQAEELTFRTPKVRGLSSGP